ncbi:PPK2 family polyphosphate kinase [Diaminobutyricibacter sp. McL0608]|uniref:PPK2 family polyphosphate kinase n=1 Tax=Leifsonia sp. McL0608 TaxID=3143537 RepID=UPI0031F2E62C
MRETFWTDDPRDLLRVRDGFVLATSPTNARPGFDRGKKHGAYALSEGSAVLRELQERLFAAGTVGTRRQVLLVLQAMDTAGKGGIVTHVIRAVDPNGVHYVAFKKPNEVELAHDFLWRVAKQVPAAGELGVFDRSHYEDVLIARVRELVPPKEIERRYDAINRFELGLVDSGTVIVKVMLHISKDEQKKRLTRRLDREDKHWKYNPADVDERLHWDEYQDAFQRVFEKTSTDWAPWYVIPADHKWYARLAVQHLLIEALDGLDLGWPEVGYDIEAEKARLAAS